MDKDFIKLLHGRLPPEEPKYIKKSKIVYSIVMQLVGIFVVVCLLTILLGLVLYMISA
jgi:hypothetical protein